MELVSNSLLVIKYTSTDGSMIALAGHDNVEF